jgi:hypothetical protein
VPVFRASARTPGAGRDQPARHLPVTLGRCKSRSADP